MQLGDSDGQKSELDASSEHDVHSVGDDKATYIGDMKIDTRVLDLEKKHCRVPGWRGQMIFPIDNKGLGVHRDVIQQMSTGTSKDRQLLEVLDEVITRNNEELNGKEESEHADDDLEHGNNEELHGPEESEHADDDLEDENKTKNDAMDKSHSLDLESQHESHSETDGYGNSTEDTSKLVPVTSQEMIENDSVDRDICDGGNDKESESVDQCDGPGNLIVIEPSQAKQEAEKDSIN